MGLKDLFAAHDGSTAAQQHTVSVEGMHCHGCEKRVSAALEDCGACNVVANHETGEVTYEGELDAVVVAEAVAEAGFTVV